MVVDISQFIVVLTYIFQQAPKNKYFTAYCPFNLHISRGHLKVNILQLIVVLTHIFMYYVFVSYAQLGLSELALPHGGKLFRWKKDIMVAGVGWGVMKNS